MSADQTNPDVIDAEAPAIETPEAGIAKRRPTFRRGATIKMPADAAARQGRVAKLAWDVFGEREAVLAFLNTHDQQLGGRPIDLAVASAEGLASVESAMAVHASTAPTRSPF